MTIEQNNSQEKPCTPCCSDSYDCACKIQHFEDLHLYIEEKGSDKNDGLSQKTAFATFEAVRTLMRTIDMQGNNIYVHYGVGTFREPVLIDETLYCAARRIFIEGQGKDTFFDFSGVREVTVFYITEYKNVVIKNIRIKIRDEINSTGSRGIVARGHAEVWLQGTIIFDGGYNPLVVGHYSEMNAANCTVYFNTGSYHTALTVAFHSLWYTGPNVKFIYGKEVTFRLANVHVYSHSMLWDTMEITGTATGTRYVIQHQSTINAYGKTINHFPGSVAGYTRAASYYVVQ